MNKNQKPKNKNATPRKSRSFAELPAIRNFQTQAKESLLSSVVDSKAVFEESTKLDTVCSSNNYGQGHQCLCPEAGTYCSTGIHCSSLRKQSSVEQTHATANPATNCCSSDTSELSQYLSQNVETDGSTFRHGSLLQTIASFGTTEVASDFAGGSSSNSTDNLCQYASSNLVRDSSGGVHDNTYALPTDASLELQNHAMRSDLAEEQFDIVKEIHAEGTKLKQTITRELTEEGDKIKESIQTTWKGVSQDITSVESNKTCSSIENSIDTGRTDLIILHTEKDLQAANDVVVDLAAMQPDIKQDLFSNIDQGRTGMGSLDTLHERYRIICVLVTPNLDEDELTKFHVEGLLTYGLENGDGTAYRLVPIWCMEKRKCKRVCLRAIKGLDYYHSASSKSHFSKSFRSLIEKGRKHYP